MKDTIMFDGIIRGTLISGRRAFLRFLAAGISLAILGIRRTSIACAETKNYLTSRVQSVYAHDAVMRYRKSQDNPAVKKLYADFLVHPMSPKSEELLHAIYVDRSAGIKHLK
jgi:hypothetical protein